LTTDIKALVEKADSLIANKVTVWCDLEPTFKGLLDVARVACFPGTKINTSLSPLSVEEQGHMIEQGW
jgi:hypothetical protein